MGLKEIIYHSAQGGEIKNPLAFDNRTFETFPLQTPNSINFNEYVAFGTCVFNPTNVNEILYFVRASSSHDNGDGRVVMISFNIDTGLRTNLTTVYSDANGVQDVEVTVIGTDIYVFFTRRDGNSFINISYVKSTDSGVTFEPRVDVHTTVPADQKAYNPFGKGFEGATGEFYQPWYDVDNDNTDGRVLLFKTIDNGANWTTIVVQGPEPTFPYNETTFKKVSTNQYIAISRKTGGGLHQIESTDLNTFTAPVVTPMALGTSMADLTLQGTKLICWFQQRGNPRGIYFSKVNNFTTVIGSPTSWPARTLIIENDDIRSGIGYPSVLELGNDEYFLIWHREITTSRCDLFFQRVKIV